MNARVPEPIKPILAEYMTRMDADLPGLMTAFYVQGSIALGAFNELFSDIDFITVVSRSCSTSDVAHVRTIHQTLEQRYPRWPLEGSYIQWGEKAIVSHLNYHDGQLRPESNLDVNDVTWWVLKNRGITLKGCQAHELDLEVDWNVLIANMRNNLNMYWAQYVKNPSRMVWLLTDYGVQWAVLGVLRQYFSFREHSITSKTGAGVYALAHVGVRWHRIIQEALVIRNKSGRSLYPL